MPGGYGHVLLFQPVEHGVAGGAGLVLEHIEPCVPVGFVGLHRAVGHIAQNYAVLAGGIYQKTDMTRRVPRRAPNADLRSQVCLRLHIIH